MSIQPYYNTVGCLFEGCEFCRFVELTRESFHWKLVENILWLGWWHIWEDYRFSNLLILCIKVPKYLLDIAITQSLAIVSIASHIDRPNYLSAEVFFDKWLVRCKWFGYVHAWITQESRHRSKFSVSSSYFSLHCLQANMYCKEWWRVLYSHNMVWHYFRAGHFVLKAIMPHAWK